MILDFFKPKCHLHVTQGDGGKWRWVARSVDVELVDGVRFKTNEIIAQMTVGSGTETRGQALAAGLAAMRGWKCKSFGLPTRPANCPPPPPPSRVEKLTKRVRGSF